MVREISQKGWKTFCERLTDSCKGAMLRIELQRTDGTKLDIARDVALRGIRFDADSDPCNTNLIIEAGQNEPIRHIVVEPIYIRLRSNGQEERFSLLEIMAENGTTSALLSPGITPETLKGLEAT